MPMRRPTTDEIARWDSLVASDPALGSVWQFEAYTGFRGPVWSPVRAVHELRDGTSVYASYMERSIPGFGKLWYCSCGPRVSDPDQFAEITAQLRGLRRPFAIIVEPPIPVSGPDDAAAIAAPLDGVRPFPPVQLIAAHTVLVDLRPSEQEILASFKQRTRRSIRKAADATVEFVADESAFDPFWKLYELMLDRSGIYARPREYFEAYWRTYLDAGQGTFVFATLPGEDSPAAAAFAIQHENVALYKDGGSVRSREANGLQYRVQWESMRWAKQRGAVSYDMFGAPASWLADDESQLQHGLVQFKTGFAPIVDYAGGFVVVQRPLLWEAWNRVGFRAYQHWLSRRGQFVY